MQRRSFLQAAGIGATTPTLSRKSTALCLNEDNSHWFFTRAGQQYTASSVASFVDQYAGTQVRELILSANSQRTSFDSRAWDPVWKGYDPTGPDDQPLFRSTPEAARAGARKWVHTAWQLAQQQIDPYALWIARARSHGISPWVSMRMNDLHNVDDPASYMHSTFWREHPEYRRVPWRFLDWRDRAFDFGHAAVREYHFRLIEEYVSRYDFDGLELDWMRFGFHFRPGAEREGGELLTAFMRRVRSLLDTWQGKRRHPIALGARVPSRPQAAIDLGMDGARWAREGLITMLVATPFWETADTAIPVETWRRLTGDRVILACGLEVLLRPFNAYRPLRFNTLETVRGAAATLLARGADRVYLFNYMDSQTEMADRENYPTLLRECGRLDTLAGKPRRHVVTYADTQAPGEPVATQLPRKLAPKEWGTFRIDCGPKMKHAQLRLELEGGALAEVRVNGIAAEAAPTDKQFSNWQIPDGVDGVAVVHVQAATETTVRWVEIAGD